MHQINGAVILKGPGHIVVRNPPNLTTSNNVSQEKSKNLLDIQKSQMKLRSIKSNHSETRVNLNSSVALNGSEAWKEWYETKMKEAARKKEKLKINEQRKKELDEFEKEKKRKEKEGKKLNFHAWLEKKRIETLNEKHKLNEKLEVNKQVLNLCTKVKDSLSREKVRAWAQQKSKEVQIKKEQELEMKREQQEIAKKEEAKRINKNASAWSDWAERAKLRPSPDKTLLKPIVYNQRHFEKILRESGVWVNPEPWCSTFTENDEDSETEYLTPLITTPTVMTRNSIRGITS